MNAFLFARIQSVPKFSLRLVVNSYIKGTPLYFKGTPLQIKGYLELAQPDVSLHITAHHKLIDVSE